MMPIAFVESVSVFRVLMLFVLAAGGVFLLLALVTSWMRFMCMTGRVGAGPAALEESQAENQFQVEVLRCISDRVVSAHSFALIELVIDLNSLPPDEKSRNEVAEKAEQILRSSVRADDQLFVKETCCIDLLLVGCGTEQVAGVVERLLECVARKSIRTVSGWAGIPKMRAAVAVYPDDGRSLAALLEQLQQEYAAPEIPNEEAVSAPEPPQSRLVDPLTGVLRADRAGPVMQKYLSTLRRSGKPACMLCLEIDSMDRYVKQYGENGVTALLKAVGELIGQGVRLADLPGRYGDSSFMIMTACSLEQAQSVAQRLCTVARKQRVLCGGTPLSFTLSVGVAAFPDHGRTPRELFLKADQRLHEAQRRGGNRVDLFMQPDDVSRSRAAGRVDAKRF